MGSRGIKRRKLVRHLPKVGRTTPPGPPPVMWPDEASGFEADPFSPAGTAERYWALATSRGGSRPSVPRPVLLLLVGALAVILAVAALLHLIGH